jgi:autotransporter-associated beta strand protein
MKMYAVRLLCFSFVAILFRPFALPAAELTWDADVAFPGPQDGGGNWNTLTNTWWDGTNNVLWNNSTPDSAVFGAGTADFGGVVTVPANTTNTVADIKFLVLGSGNYIISAGNAATSKLNLFGNPTVYVSNGLSAAINVVLTGTSFTKAGGGTLTLNPGAPNLFAGATYVTEGTLVIGGSSANRRVIPGDLIVTNGSTARLGQSENITNNAAVYLHAGSKLEMNSRSQTIAALLLNDGTITQSGTETLIVTGAVDVRQGAVLQSPTGAGKLDGGTLNKTTSSTVTLASRGSAASGGGLTNTALYEGTLILDYAQDLSKLLDSGSLTVNGGTLIFTNGSHTENVGSLILNNGIITNASGTVTLQIPAGTSYDVRAGEIHTVLAGSGRSLTKSTAGTVILGANNTYNGGTFISGGILQIGSGATSGTPGSTSAAVTNFGQLVFNRSDTLSISGVISGSGSVTKTGGGTLAFTPINTYLGSTTVSNGVLSIDSDATLGDGTGTLNLAGGTLNTSSSRTPSVNPVANPVYLTADSAVTTTSSSASVDLNFSNDSISGLAGTLTFRNDGADTNTDQFEPRFSGNFTFNRPIVIDNGSVGRTRLSSFNTNGTTQTFNGAISGNGSFRRSFGTGSGGVTVFNANNTYTGDTAVNNGTLLVNGSLSSSNVTVSSSGVLGGNGMIQGMVTVSSGTLSPGGSVGQLTISNSLVLQSGSSTVMELNAATGTNDLVCGLTNVNYGGTLIVTNLSGTLAGNTTFKLFAAAIYNGVFDTFILPPLGPGQSWDTSGLTHNGTIKVLSGPASPQIAALSITPDGIVVAGTGGSAGANYTVLTSTNAALPFAAWTPVATNQFGPGGEFTFTNTFSPGKPKAFFIIRVP